jgi:hypothetical protein
MRTAYKANTNFQEEKKDAVDMLERSITAVDRLSSKMQFVAFQTGAKVLFFKKNAETLETP